MYQRTYIAMFLYIIGLLFFPLTATATDDFFVADVREIEYEHAPAISIRFTQALSQETDLSTFFKVSPELDTNESIWIPQDQGRQWVLPFVQSNQRYSIRAVRRVVSTSGEELSFTESRDEQRRPIDSWTVATQPRPSSATFQNGTGYFSGDLSAGIPVTVINQKETDLDVFKVRPDKFIEFFSRYAQPGKTQNYQLDRLADVADLVHSARYTSKAKTDQEITYNFDLKEILAQTDTQGLYLAVLKKPGDYYSSLDLTYFTITNIGLHVRRYNESLAFYVHDVTTAAPIANASLELFWWYPNRERQFLETDASGKATWLGNRFPALILARQANKISFIRLTGQEALDLSDYSNVVERHQNIQGFFFGPRDLYRPGESLKANLLLKDHDGRPLQHPLPLQTRIYDGRGQKVAEYVSKPNIQGIYPFQYDIAQTAAAGRWRITVGVDENTVLADYNFQVESFIPERLALNLPANNLQIPVEASNGHFSLAIQGKFLYGAAASGLTVDAVVTASSNPHPFKDWPDYAFGNSDFLANPASKKTNAIKLDAEGVGDLTIELPNQWQDSLVPLTITASTSLYETGGRPVTRNWQGLWLPKVAKIPGIKPSFNENPDANSQVYFDLVSVSPQGKPDQDRLSVRLIHYPKYYYYEYLQSRGWQQKNKQDAEVTGAWSVTLDSSKPFRLGVPVRWGFYELEVTSESGASSRYAFTTGWSPQVTGNNRKPQFIDIHLDKQTYQPGETINAKAHSPYKGTALITLSSGEGVIQEFQQPLEQGDNTLAITLANNQSRHDLYLTVMLINPTDQVDPTSPRRALGLSPVPILRHDAIAQVELASPEKSESNQSITAKLKVVNFKELGEQPLYATFALVDRGILNITGYAMPQPELSFYSQRRFESIYYDTYDKFIDNRGYETLSQRFGGDAAKLAQAMARGGALPKSDVQILSYFSDPISIENGEAEVSFPLPIFGGELEWQAWVYGDQSYGSQQSKTIIADPIITQISKPRFLAKGDSSQLTFDISNQSEQSQSITINASIDPILGEKHLNESRTIQVGEHQTLVLPIQAEQTGSGQIRLEIKNSKSGKTLNQQWLLDVRQPYPWETRFENVMIKPQESWQPQLKLANIQVDSLLGRLTISNRPAINFASQFDHLIHYPYGCLEQTTSSTYPWLLIEKNSVDELGLFDQIKSTTQQNYSEELRQDMVLKGIKRLEEKQLGNGSFGYWNQTSAESYWGTVNATELLVDARLQGIPVNSIVLKKALNRLDDYVKGKNLNTPRWNQDKTAHEITYRAYAAYVLAKAKSARLSDIRRLYQIMETETDHIHTGLVWMHLAGALKLSQDFGLTTKANQKALETKHIPGYYGDYGTELRDYSQALAIALSEQLDTGKLFQQVTEQLGQKKYLSTQERVSLARLHASMPATNEPWNAHIDSANQSSEINRVKPLIAAYQGHSLTDLKTVKAINHPLFINLEYQGAPSQPPAVTSNDVEISRKYYDLEGNALDVQQVKTGDLLLVSLEVQLHNQISPIPDALVVDLLPAGFELENQNLAQAGLDLDSLQVDGRRVTDYQSSGRPDYEDYKDDRYLAALTVYANQSNRLFYLMRAVTPGHYQIPNPMVEDMYRPESRGIGATPGWVTILAK